MGKVSRRTMLKGLGAAVTAAAFGKAISPLAGFLETTSVEEFLQQHFKELTDEDKAALFARLEKRTSREYGVDVSIGHVDAGGGQEFAYALNLSVCIGCRQCVEACHVENNHDRLSRNSYITVFEMEQGSLDLEKGEAGYEHPVPAEGKFYLPVQCQQCGDPPCVKVCPVEATWKEEDGLVVVDHEWCIGCRYCEAACPYHARRFNWRQAEIPADEIVTEQGYFSNRMRPVGAMEKCTFCLHRTREGRLPACLEACPAGARVFGNMLYSESPVRYVLNEKRVFVLKEELGTEPRFFYFFDK